MDKSPSTPAESQWRDSLHKELCQRRIPSAWQRRLMGELDDHLADLKEEHMATTDPNTFVERLGDPAQIAATAAAEYRKLGFFARRPVVTYFLLPLVATPIWMIVFMTATGVLMAWTLDRIESLENTATASSAANAIVATTVNLWRFVPFAIVAWCFVRLARRHGRGWRCVLASCGVVAIYAALFGVSMQAKTASEPGSLMLGFHLPPQTVLPYLQAAIPLAIAAWFHWRSRPHRNDRLPASEPTPTTDLCVTVQ